LEEVNKTGTTGGNIRALVKGSWGFVSFNYLGKLQDKVALAVSEAKLASREELKLSSVEPVVDTVAQKLKRDSATVPVAAKKQALDECNDIMLSSPRIQKVEKITVEEMVEYGNHLITMIRGYAADILCDVEVAKGKAAVSTKLPGDSYPTWGGWRLFNPYSASF